MALKPDRHIVVDEITYTCESAASAGVVLCYKTAGSGSVIGDTAGLGDLMAASSGNKPLGLLLQDVVSIDETLYHRNFPKLEAKVGEKVWLLRKGWVVTDKLAAGTTPTQGDTAYLTVNGTITPTNGGAAATPKVGEFMGKKDENGYVRVFIDLPIV